jgi:hypothetical protein
MVVRVLLFIALAIGVVVALVPTGGAPNAARRTSCWNNGRQIALALERYRARNKSDSYPPAYIVGPDGKPWHSWRMLILPDLEQHELYNKYNFDEPWDGPNNRMLWDQMPAIYRCQGRASAGCRDGVPFGAHRYSADFVAVVDLATCWPGAQGYKPTRRADNLATTILVLEHTGNRLPWTAPVDLTMAQALTHLSTRSQGHIDLHHGLFTTTLESSLYLGVFRDMSAEFSDSLGCATRPLARAMLTAEGGENIALLPLGVGPAAQTTWTLRRDSPIPWILMVLALAIALRRWLRFGGRHSDFSAPQASAPEPPVTNERFRHPRR